MYRCRVQHYRKRTDASVNFLLHSSLSGEQNPEILTEHWNTPLEEEPHPKPEESNPPFSDWEPWTQIFKLNYWRFLFYFIFLLPKIQHIKEYFWEYFCNIKNWNNLIQMKCFSEKPQIVNSASFCQKGFRLSLLEKMFKLSTTL